MMEKDVIDGHVVTNGQHVIDAIMDNQTDDNVQLENDVKKTWNADEVSEAHLADTHVADVADGHVQDLHSKDLTKFDEMLNQNVDLNKIHLNWIKQEDLTADDSMNVNGTNIEENHCGDKLSVAVKCEKLETIENLIKTDIKKENGFQVFSDISPEHVDTDHIRLNVTTEDKTSLNVIIKDEENEQNKLLSPVIRVKFTSTNNTKKSSRKLTVKTTNSVIKRAKTRPPGTPKLPNKKAKKCNKCSKMFSDHRLLRSHQIRWHNMIYNRRFQCQFCEACFPLKEFLVGHVKVHTGEFKYKCDTCQRGFERNKALRAHVSSRHTQPKPKPDPKELKFKCSVCSKAFKNERGLGFHRKQIHLQNYMEYECSICQEKFTKKREFKLHKSVHDDKNEYKFACIQCPLKFKNNGALQTHVLHKHDFVSKHSASDSLQCRHCEQTFTNKTKMSLHELKCDKRQHFSFDCIECDVKFETKKQLINHKKGVHEVDGLKCPICYVTFTWYETIPKHIRAKHGEPTKHLLCQYCGQRFSDSRELRVHIGTHTDEGKPQCSVCGRYFMYERDVRRHMVSHSDVKPYNCEHCGKALGSRTAWMYHQNVKKCGQNKTQVSTEPS